MKKGRAECEVVPEKYYSEEAREIGTQYLYRFSYNVGWLYYPPLMEYIIILYLGKDQNLLDIWVGKEYGGL